MCVGPLVYISPRRRDSHGQDPDTVIFLFDETTQERIRPEVNISLACCLDGKLDVFLWSIRFLFSHGFSHFNFNVLNEILNSSGPIQTITTALYPQTTIPCKVKPTAVSGCKKNCLLQSHTRMVIYFKYFLDREVFQYRVTSISKETTGILACSREFRFCATSCLTCVNHVVHFTLKLQKNIFQVTLDAK